MAWSSVHSRTSAATTGSPRCWPSSGASRRPSHGLASFSSAFTREARSRSSCGPSAAARTALDSRPSGPYRRLSRRRVPLSAPVPLLDRRLPVSVLRDHPDRRGHRPPRFDRPHRPRQRRRLRIDQRTPRVPKARVVAARRAGCALRGRAHLWRRANPPDRSHDRRRSPDQGGPGADRTWGPGTRRPTPSPSSGSTKLCPGQRSRPIRTSTSSFGRRRPTIAGFPGSRETCAMWSHVESIGP